MSLMNQFKPATLLIAAVLAFGCNKNRDESRSNANSVTDAPVVAEFTTLDTNTWVNGSPVSLVDARGKNVILIEAWHPT